VVASNSDLKAEITAGRFREDLYYRLCVAKVEIPPLRDRPREISLLARMFLNQARVRQRRQAMALSASAAALLARHAWPGNVRELKNTMEFLAATVDDDVLDVRHLPEPVAAGAPKGPEAAATPPPGPTSSSTPSKFLPLSKEVEQLERTRMEEALEATKGVKAHAAALLGMPIRTFIEKYKRFRFPEQWARTPK